MTEKEEKITEEKVEIQAQNVVPEVSAETSKNNESKKVAKPKKEKKEKKKKEKDFTPSDLEALKEKLDRKENGFFEKLTTKRFVKKATHDIIVKRLVGISLMAILLIIGVLYALSYTYTNAAGYGINIVADRTNSRYISLSENSEFERLSVGLRAIGIDSLDNITYDWLPTDLDEALGGSNNGNNYISYTFYVLNTGVGDLTYRSYLYILSSTLEVETAIRIQVFKNGVSTIYTHTYEEFDSFLENTRMLTVEEFYTEGVVSQNDNFLQQNTNDKYTIVIWLEGEDIDCVDDKRSGSLEIAWKFSVLDEE